MHPRPEQRSRRPPAVAGSFYPADPETLDRQVEGFLAAARLTDPDTTPPKAIIAPHAGYLYSGPVAGSAFARLAPLRGTVTRVILLGPSHFVPFDGIATSSAESFATPLGDIPVDVEAVAAACRLPGVQVLDAAHEREHCLEVELPFLQKTLGNFSIVPFVVGDAAPEAVADLLELLWGGDETLIVVSSDLSHYHDHREATRLDTEASEAIRELRPDDLAPGHACGRVPIQGLLLACRRRGLGGRVLDLRNSGDTAGPKDRVVGYGAFAFG